MREGDGEIQKGEELAWAEGISQSRALIKLKEIMSMSHLFTIAIQPYLHVLRCLMTRHPLLT